MNGRNVGQIEAGANPTSARRAVLELTLGLPIGGLLLKEQPARQQDIPRPTAETPTPTRAAAA
jgi:hypothetical protein